MNKSILNDISFNTFQFFQTMKESQNKLDSAHVSHLDSVEWEYCWLSSIGITV